MSADASLFDAYPHNRLLSVWIQTGAVGLLAFAFLLFAFVQYALDLRNPGNAPSRLTAVTIAALLSALIFKNMTNDFYERIVPVAFWTYMGWLVGHGVRISERSYAPV